jgi:hypothetical protein
MGGEKGREAERGRFMESHTHRNRDGKGDIMTVE